jgi:hypothetical protein
MRGGRGGGGERRVDEGGVGGRDHRRETTVGMYRFFAWIHEGALNEVLGE